MEGKLILKFKGQFFLFDIKTKIYINGKFHSKQSTKRGFQIEIPIDKDAMNIKASIGGFRNSNYSIKDLNIYKTYVASLHYNTILGQYSNQLDITEI